MFGWLFGDRTKKIEEDTRKGFSAVKDDMNLLGKWVKHLDSTDKQLLEAISQIKGEISSIRSDLEILREEHSIQKEALEDELKELQIQLASVQATTSWLSGLAENVKV